VSLDRRDLEIPSSSLVLNVQSSSGAEILVCLFEVSEGFSVDGGSFLGHPVSFLKVFLGISSGQYG